MHELGLGLYQVDLCMHSKVLHCLSFANTSLISQCLGLKKFILLVFEALTNILFLTFLKTQLCCVLNRLTAGQDLFSISVYSTCTLYIYM